MWYCFLGQLEAHIFIWQRMIHKKGTSPLSSSTHFCCGECFTTRFGSLSLAIEPPKVTIESSTEGSSSNKSTEKEIGQYYYFTTIWLTLNNHEKKKTKKIIKIFLDNKTLFKIRLTSFSYFETVVCITRLEYY